jgi:hypothetical protein
MKQAYEHVGRLTSETTIKQDKDANASRVKNILLKIHMKLEVTTDYL